MTIIFMGIGMIACWCYGLCSQYSNKYL